MTKEEKKEVASTVGMMVLAGLSMSEKGSSAILRGDEGTHEDIVIKVNSLTKKFLDQLDLDYGE